jgi:hypothetical protein
MIRPNVKYGVHRDDPVLMMVHSATESSATMLLLGMAPRSGVPPSFCLEICGKNTIFSKFWGSSSPKLQDWYPACLLADSYDQQMEIEEAFRPWMRLGGWLHQPWHRYRITFDFLHTAASVLLIIICVGFFFICEFVLKLMTWTILTNNFCMITTTMLSGLLIARVGSTVSLIKEDQHKVIIYESVLIITLFFPC